MTVFATREQGKAFKDFWKGLYAQGYHKPVREPQMDTYSKKVVGYRMVSPMDGVQHLIHRLALGRKVDKGFGNAFKMARNYPAIYRKERITEKYGALYREYFTDEQWDNLTTQVMEFLQKH